MERRAEMLNVMNLARQRGAVAAEILRVHEEILEQSDSRGAATEQERERWRVQLWRGDGTRGEGAGETKEEALERAAADVRAADANSAPAERMPIRTSGLGIDDRRHLSIGAADRAEVLHTAERSASSALYRLARMTYWQERSTRSFLSSRGGEAEESATTYGIAASAVVEGRTISQRLASRRFSDVASLPFGTELKRRLEPLYRRVAALPDLPIVLEPRATAELFRSLAPAFSAEAIAARDSFLHGCAGKRIASPIFHLTDDAGLFGGLRTWGFDDRGVPPIPVTLLKEGVVTGLYHTPESARANGLRPTGHCAWESVSPSNLVVRPGSRTRNVTLGELGSYLLLDSPPPMELATGRLAGEVDLVLVERGERRGSLRRPIDAAVQAILSSVQEVVSDHERNMEIDAPTAIFAPRFGLSGGWGAA